VNVLASKTVVAEVRQALRAAYDTMISDLSVLHSQFLTEDLSASLMGLQTQLNVHSIAFVPCARLTLMLQCIDNQYEYPVEAPITTECNGCVTIYSPVS
jgi:hypothetical protein